MGRRGPPRKPTKLTLVAGNPGKRKVNQKEPKPTPGEPTCPKWIGSKAKQIWDEVIPELRAMRMLAGVDGHALAAYCKSYARYRAAEEFIDRHGQTFVFKDDKGNPKGVQALPEVAIAKFYLIMVRNYQQELGLTPSARAGIEIPDSPEDEAKFEKFFGPKTPKGRK